MLKHVKFSGVDSLSFTFSSLLTFSHHVPGKCNMSENIIKEDEFLPINIDRDAFDKIFREFYAKLYAYACLLVDMETAEDIVQEVFVYLWENRQRMAIHTSLKAYLFKAAHNRCLNVINRLKMRNHNHDHIERELKAYEAGFYDPDKNEIIRRLYMNDLRAEIDRAIESLPPKCREVFRLSYMQDLKNKEISARLNISVSTVEKHINHALKVLRQLLLDKLTLFIIIFSIP
jgi:RNA polymerase sigma-70 factor (ECF subfamily)